MKSEFDRAAKLALWIAVELFLRGTPKLMKRQLASIALLWMGMSLLAPAQTNDRKAFAVQIPSSDSLHGHY